MLRSIMLDPGIEYLARAQAASALAAVDEKATVADLLHLFFSQADQMALWETALTLENLGSRVAVPALARALQNENPHRRHAAARALGWIGGAGRAAAIPLMHALADTSQPQPVREEAAESLAYLGYMPAVPALISALADADVRIRFWAVFALGSLARPVILRRGRRGEVVPPDANAINALEQMIEDDAIPPGDWWSVAREAIAMLGSLTERHRRMLDAEIASVLEDPHASAADKRWAEFYA